MENSHYLTIRWCHIRLPCRWFAYKKDVFQKYIICSTIATTYVQGVLQHFHGYESTIWGPRCSAYRECFGNRLFFPTFQTVVMTVDMLSCFLKKDHFGWLPGTCFKLLRIKPQNNILKGDKMNIPSKHYKFYPVLAPDGLLKGHLRDGWNVVYNDRVRGSNQKKTNGKRFHQLPAGSDRILSRFNRSCI